MEVNSCAIRIHACMQQLTARCRLQRELVISLAGSSLRKQCRHMLEVFWGGSGRESHEHVTGCKHLQIPNC